MNFALINRTSVIPNNLLDKIADAITVQLVYFCREWHLEPRFCKYIPEASLKADYEPIYLYDKTPEAPDAAGYHTEENGKIFAKIACSDILDAGGGISRGRKINEAVSAVIHHEILESLINPNVNRWIISPVSLNGTSYSGLAFEVGDPVQDNTFSIDDVLLSNYVLPAWTDPDNKTGPWDKLGVLKGPLTIAPGGYAIALDDQNNPKAVFADNKDARPWRARSRVKKWL